MLRNKFTVILCVIIFILIYSLNILTPLFGDDWIYMGIYGIKKFVLIDDFYQIIVSQYNHYFQWGGRTVVHALDQALLMLDQRSRAIFKSILFVLFIVIILKIIILEYDSFIFKPFILIISLVFISYPHFEEVMLWTTGVSNYLFSMCLALLFVYPYYKFYLRGYKTIVIKSKYCNVLFFLLGIVTGWTQENIIASIIFLIFCFYVYLFYLRSKIPGFFILGTLGLLLGYTLLISAPGNFVRASQESLDMSYNNLSIFEIMISRIKNIIRIYRNYLPILVLNVSFLVLFLIIKQSKVSRDYDSKKVNVSFFFFLSANISSFVMLFATSFPIRATFPLITMLIISNTILILEIRKIPYVKLIFYPLCIILLCLCVSNYKTLYNRAKLLKIAVDCRNELILKDMAKGNLDIVLKKDQIPKSNFYWDFLPDSTSWINQTYCRVYGLKTIRVLP